MCQLRFAFRYCALALCAGSNVTLKISLPSGAATSPSILVNANWLSSSRCRPRIITTPRHFSASSSRAITTSSKRVATLVTRVNSTPTDGVSAAVSTGNDPPPGRDIFVVATCEEDLRDTAGSTSGLTDLQQ